MQPRRKASRLSPIDYFLLVQAWSLYLLAELGLRMFRFDSLVRLSRLRSALTAIVSSSASPVSVERLAWLVQVAGRFSPVQPTCLKQAMILFWLLDLRGLTPTLRIGVAHDQGSFAAHAWVEWRGEVIMGRSGCDRYLPLVSIG
jgi:hypothetical protein